MFFAWLKRYMPRGLYGRAALILLLPIVLLQTVVTIAFLQRHFEDVTRQMTRNVALEMGYVLSAMEAPGRTEGLTAAFTRAAPLGIEVIDRVGPEGDARRWYDISGVTVIRTLREELPEVLWVDLAADDKRVALAADTPRGPVILQFDRRRVSASNPHQLLVLTVFSGFLLTLIAFAFLRNQLRPIKRLSRAADAFGRGQRIEYHPSGATEVRAAGNAFLSMRNRIERQIEQRTMMLSGVSHDLRTPLTRLKLGLSMLDEAEAADLRRDVEDMEEMVTGFLDFARGDARENTERVGILALVEGVVERAASTGQPVTVVQEGEEVELAVRPMAIKRAVANLIGNALRYGGSARVTVTILDSAVRIRVEDPGPGIPPNQREEALRPFARLDTARNQDSGTGTGLGLAITSDIARAHGGTLRLGQSADLGGLSADLVLGR
jgi:two-component system osmolarity sensor histidine kinase EnvZ